MVLFEKIESLSIKRLTTFNFEEIKMSRRDIRLVDNRLRVKKKMWSILVLSIISFLVSPVGQRFLRGALTPPTQSSIIQTK